MAQFGVLGKLISLALLHGEQMDEAFRSLITALQLPMFGFPKTDAEVRAFHDVCVVIGDSRTYAR